MTKRTGRERNLTNCIRQILRRNKAAYWTKSACCGIAKKSPPRFLPHTTNIPVKVVVQYLSIQKVVLSSNMHLIRLLPHEQFTTTHTLPWKFLICEMAWGNDQQVFEGSRTCGYLFPNVFRQVTVVFVLCVCVCHLAPGFTFSFIKCLRLKAEDFKLDYLKNPQTLAGRRRGTWKRLHTALRASAATTPAHSQMRSRLTFATLATLFYFSFPLC